MELLSVAVLQGPNVWARVSVIEARVDFSRWPSAPHRSRAQFQQRLDAWLPELARRRPTADQHGEIDDRLPCGAWLAEALQQVALELQALAGTPVSFGNSRGPDDRGVYRVAVEYQEEKVGRACLDSARGLCVAAAQGDALDVPAELTRLRDLAERLFWGSSTEAIVAAARARGIPVRRLNDLALVQLGYGAQQRRVQNAVTDRTGAIAEAISTDKELTKALLRELGVPVPEGRPVASAEDAWAAACALGPPLVVKPQNADYGEGVSLSLTTREQVAAAYEAARGFSKKVLVERFVPGTPHRVLVVADRMVAAVRREPPRVVGDGHSTVAELVAEANRDPRRGDAPTDPLCKMSLDEAALRVLAEQGYTGDSVPPAGAEVLLHRQPSYFAGATNDDVTERVHPEVAAQCVCAARLVGLDVAGVDVVAEDIARPLEEQSGAILEVNPEPGISLHLHPLSNPPRPVGEAIVDWLFPAGQSGRIPLAVVTGLGENLNTARRIAELLLAAGRQVGRACCDGMYLGPRRVKTGDQASAAGTRAVLLCPQVEAAVLERPLDSIRNEGLAFDLCHVAVVTPLTGERGPLLEHEELLQAARVLVESVSRDGFLVIDADDPAAVAMIPSCPGSVILVCSRPDHPLLSERRNPAHRAVCLQGDQLVLTAGDGEDAVAVVDSFPVPVDLERGRGEMGLLAAAAAWALGLPLETIRTWLTSAGEHWLPRSGM